MLKAIQKISKGISSVSEWTGKTARWLVIIIIAVVVYEVFVRYALNSPTSWAWSLSYMLGACMYALGFSYNWLHNSNVRVDAIYQKFSPRLKLIIDILFTFFFCFPAFE